MRRVRAAFVVTLIAVALAAGARVSAHDIPRDVTVQAFVKPEGQRLRLLVRVPLKAVMDVEFPRRDGEYLDLARVEPSLRDAARIWLANKIELYEGDARVPDPVIVTTRFSLESDRSFATYEGALARVTGPPLAANTRIFWEQGLLDVLFEYPIESDRSRFSIHAGFDRLALSVITALQFIPPGGAIRAYELEGDAGLVRLDPRWHQAMSRFVGLGLFHILDGIDHLLFLLCLVIPFRRIRPLVLIVTSFTLAHSITLIASAYGVAPDALWFPPLIEMLIAASIVYMALENIVVAQPAHRWIITFLFGLAHGFGFSFGLEHTLQFAGSHLVTSLLSFNIGVELGQLVVLAMFVPVLHVLFRFVMAERMGIIILSALVAHTGWHWMTERADTLRQFPWPVITAAGVAAAMRWVMVAVALAGLVWVASLLVQRAADRRTAGASDPAAT